MRTIFTVLLLMFFASCAASEFETSLKQAEESIGLGKYEDAVKIYENLIDDFQSGSKRSVVYLRLGDLYAYTLLDLNDALKMYQKCIESEPASEAARLAHERRANIFEQAGQPLLMAQEYIALIKYFPDHDKSMDYKMRLGEAYISSKEFQQARQELRGFVEKTGIPKEMRHQALFDIGETYFLESKPGKAVRFYYAFIQESPDSPLVPEAKLRIATCLEEMGYLGMAQKFADEAAKSYPNPGVIEERMEGLKSRGKSQKKKKDVPKLEGGY